ncbi:MAG: site-specific integrase [Aestuariivirgaceae bacterium]
MPRRNPGPRLRYLKKRATFYIVWYEAGRERLRGTGTASRPAAEIALGEFLRSRAYPRGPRDPHEVAVTDIMLDYLEQHAPNVAARDRIAYAVEALAPFAENKAIDQITESWCQDYRRQRQRSDSTVRRELGVLRAAIQWAVATNRLTRPVKIHLPPEAAPRDRWLTRGEAAMLLAGALGFDATGRRVARPQYHLALFILIGLYTGRRMEAILSLQWRQLDLRSGWIDFTRPGKAETKKRRGRCRIPDRLLPHLKRAARFGCDVGPVISWAGRPVKNIRKTFETAAARVGLDDVNRHTLKHSAISWAMQSGEDPWRVADFFATSLTTLLKHYGHHHPDQQRELASRIGRRPGIVRVKT